MHELEENEPVRAVGGKHLLSREALAAISGASAEDVTHGHRRGNGVRIHGIYVVVVSITALVVLIAFIAIASATM